jgi:hypothetical protein
MIKRIYVAVFQWINRPTLGPGVSTALIFVAGGATFTEGLHESGTREVSLLLAGILFILGGFRRLRRPSKPRFGFGKGERNFI